MKAKQIAIFPFLTSLLVLLATGCATESTKSFNQDYGENSAVAPTYDIVDKNDTCFQIRLFQGATMHEPQRSVEMKDDATLIANAECNHRNWIRWQMNYIRQSTDGWKQILIVNVVREK